MTFQMLPEDYKQLFAQEMLEHMPSLLNMMEELLSVSEKLIGQTNGVKVPKSFKDVKEQIALIKTSVDGYKTKIDEAIKLNETSDTPAIPKTLDESDKELESHIAEIEAAERAEMKRRALKFE